MEKTTQIVPKRVFITGATSGLGREAAIELARRGHHVWFLARSKDKSTALVNELKDSYPKSTGKLIPVNGDLADFQSIVKACEYLKSQTEALDVLIQNAGIWNFGFQESVDGIEETWQVNTVAPVLITKLLFGMFQKGNDPRIILTASGLHQGTIRFSDPEFRNSFSSFKTYRQSKLAVMLITRYWAEAFKTKGVFVCCQHPGLVSTELVRRGGWFANFFFRVFGRSPKKGAETLIDLSLKPSHKLESGAFYKDHKVRKTTAYSYRMDEAKKLIEMIEETLREKRLI